MDSLEQKTILLVEDNPVIALEESTVLGSFGYKVILAPSGLKAVDIAINDMSVNLILMDIDLGSGIDGTETARLILRSRALPIVFLTAHSEREMVEKVRGITRYGYIIKNSGEFVLHSSIEMAFELFQAHQDKQKQVSILREREESLSITLQSIGDGVITTNTAGQVTRMNRVAELLTGWSFIEAYLKPLQEIFHIVSAETREKVQNPVDKVMQSGNIVGLDNHTILISRDGKERQIADSAAPIKDHNVNLMGVILTFSDVTEKYKAQEALKISEEKFRKAFITNPDSININRMQDGLYIAINEGFTKITGYTEAEVIGKTSLEINIWADPADRAALVAGLKAHGKVENLEARFCFKNGVVHLGIMSASIIELNGELCIISITRDIHQQKMAEEALKISESKYRGLVNLAVDGILVGSHEGFITEANACMSDITGYKREELIGKHIGDVLFTPESLKATPLRFDLLKKGETVVSERTILRPDGTSVVVEMRSKMMPDGSYQSIYRDITKRKEIENSLIESRERLDFALTATNDAIWDYILPADAIYWSPRYLTMLGYEANEMRPSVNTWRSLIHPEDMERLVSQLDACIKGNSDHYIQEGRFRAKNGEYRWILVRGKVVGRHEDGTIARLAGTHTDITERKVAEERVKNLLQEKEILLREVHHRIKNNMNTIVSLLSLQARSLKDDEAVTALNEAKSRVQSMMVLYDKLYRSSNFLEIPVKQYLPSLINEIIQNFSQRDKVKIQTNIDDFTLDSSILSHLGIIVNELLTNAMKHAFTGRTDCLIGVSAQCRDDQVTIIIQDNGKGMPDVKNIKESTGFGLKLVGLLTEQMNGSIAIEYQDGVKFKLEFEK